MEGIIGETVRNSTRFDVEVKDVRKFSKISFNIDNEHFRAVKNLIRNGHHIKVVRKIVDSLKKKNKGVCMKALVLLDMIFSKSHDCRVCISELLFEILGFCSLNEHRKLKIFPANDFGEIVSEKCIEYVYAWDEKYGDYYANLHTAALFLKSIQTNLNSANDIGSKPSQKSNKGDDATITSKSSDQLHLLKLLLLKNDQVLAELPEITSIEDTLSELNNIFEIIYPIISDVEVHETAVSISTGSPSQVIKEKAVSKTLSNMSDDDTDHDDFDNIMWESNDLSKNIGSTNNECLSSEGSSSSIMGYLGNKYYCLELTISVSLNQLESFELKDTEGNSRKKIKLDNNCANAEVELAPVVRELSYYLARSGLKKLHYWKSILSLFLMHYDELKEKQLIMCSKTTDSSMTSQELSYSNSFTSLYNVDDLIARITDCLRTKSSVFLNEKIV